MAGWPHWEGGPGEAWGAKAGPRWEDQRAGRSRWIPTLAGARRALTGVRWGEHAKLVRIMRERAVEPGVMAPSQGLGRSLCLESWNFAS